MENKLITILDNRFDDYTVEENVLKEINPKIEVCRSLEESEIIKAIKNTNALIVNLAPITEKVIKNLSKCKVISRYGVGYDNVDVNEATKYGIWVANVPDYSVEDVSDHALALLLASIRRIPYKDRKIRMGKWNLHKDQPIYRISGKICGIVGYGAIARAFHRKVSCLGLKEILVYDPYVNDNIIGRNGAKKVSLRLLLNRSDYISIHVPLNNETRGMFGENEFKMMKNNAIIINTSRGGIIEEKSLVNALNNGIIGYAGLDVFEKEPLPKDSPLLKLDNVILTDHVAYYSEESLVELKTKAALNVLEVLKGNPPKYPVNNPL